MTIQEGLQSPPPVWDRHGGFNRAPVFEGPNGAFVADTCAPLRDAGEHGDIGLWGYGRGSYPGKPMEADVLPQLTTVGLWEASTEQDWGLAWHRNEGIEFTCLIAGEVSFSCEENDFDLKPGQITITRPWQLHRVGRPAISQSTLLWFILDVGVRRPNQPWNWPEWLPIPQNELTRLTELLSHNERSVWTASKELLSAVGTLQKTLRSELSQPMARIGTSVSEVFIELREMLESQQPILDPYLSSTERTVRLFLNQLPERLQEPWTIDAMAAQCGLGRTRFVHYCKQMVNLPPLEFLSNLRLRQACHLLTTTPMTISDIAQVCGFQSSQYFATVFRRHVGKQPAAYRHLKAVTQEA
jgi:AraC-like DNA-binding protein